MKFNFKQMLKVPASYLEKQKCFFLKKVFFLAVVNIKTKKLCLLTQFSGKVLAVSCWLVYGGEANSLFFIVVVLRIWPLLLLSYVHHNGVALFLEYNSFPDYRVSNIHQVIQSFFNNVYSPMLLFKLFSLRMRARTTRLLFILTPMISREIF